METSANPIGSEVPPNRIFLLLPPISFQLYNPRALVTGQFVRTVEPDR